MQTELSNFVTGSKKRGRPAKHIDGAARVAAHRATNTRLDIGVSPVVAETLSRLAGELDCSRNELVASMINFALMNRNWSQVGLFNSGRKN